MKNFLILATLFAFTFFAPFSTELCAQTVRLDSLETSFAEKQKLLAQEQSRLVRLEHERDSMLTILGTKTPFDLKMMNTDTREVWKCHLNQFNHWVFTRNDGDVSETSIFNQKKECLHFEKTLLSAKYSNGSYSVVAETVATLTTGSPDLKKLKPPVKLPDAWWNLKK